MLYAFGFLGLFLIGGLTGLFLGADRPRRPRARHLLRRRALPLRDGRRHDHGLPRRPALLVAEDHGRMYPEGWAKFAALLVFVGFNLTFFPQFVLGYLGMPRRYHVYPEEFQVLNVLSTAGASMLGIGYLLPMVYFAWSRRRARWRGRTRGARAASSGRRPRRRRRELPRDARGDAAGLHLHGPGEAACLTHPRRRSITRPSSTTSTRWSSSRRPRRSACGPS
jgi:heme/copper-type cytochrome/quinol oxidase subunit 1